jgi:hypothetical protein
MDVMLRWHDPDPNARQHIYEGPHRAGLRCIALLQEYPATATIPVVLHTVLERTDLSEELSTVPDNVFYVEKADTKRVVQFAGSLLATQGALLAPPSDHRDVFICHAREDRVGVVDPLISALKAEGISVWHDRAEIRWGDSLVAKIEHGLRHSRFVLAVLSKHSVIKRWPLSELNAALSGEVTDGVVKVLPLIVGDEAERSVILNQLPFQKDKAYEVWSGSPAEVVMRLRERLSQQ